MTKIAGSGSRSISQRHGSADPDPHQNVMDPEHCQKHTDPTDLDPDADQEHCYEQDGFFPIVNVPVPKTACGYVVFRSLRSVI
jgi:hypothetical protein